ncbi:MAG: hypothetical protein AABO57_28420, partial [Acidobacteriota bacterium]
PAATQLDDRGCPLEVAAFAQLTACFIKTTSPVKNVSFGSGRYNTCHAGSMQDVIVCHHIILGIAFHRELAFSKQPLHIR